MRDFSKELIVKTSVSTTVKGKNIFIPEGATNGDVIKAMFPKATISKIKSKTEQTKIAVEWHFEDIPSYYNLFYEDWWNAKYKEVE